MFQKDTLSFLIILLSFASPKESNQRKRDRISLTTVKVALQEYDITKVKATIPLK